MKLKISRSKNSCTLYVQKAFRDKTGKSTSKIVERLGSLDEVRARADGAAPMEWAMEYVRKLTLEEKEQRRVVMPRLHPSQLIPKDVVQSYVCGHLFLQRLYYKVGIDRICHTGHDSVDNFAFAVYISAQGYGILAVLLVEVVQIAEVNRLDQNNITVKFALFVGDINHIVYKCSKKITLSKLYYLNRSFFFSGHFLV